MIPAALAVFALGAWGACTRRAWVAGLAFSVLCWVGTGALVGGVWA